MARTLFTDVNIFDGTGAAPFAGEVLVQGNRIEVANAGSRATARSPASTVTDPIAPSPTAGPGRSASTGAVGRAACRRS